MVVQEDPAAWAELMAVVDAGEDPEDIGEAALPLVEAMAIVLDLLLCYYVNLSVWDVEWERCAEYSCDDIEGQLGVAQANSRLAIFELVKKSRGAVLGWAWFSSSLRCTSSASGSLWKSGSVQETVRRGRLRIFFGCAPASFLGSSYRTCWVQALMCCIGTPT